MFIEDVFDRLEYRRCEQVRLFLEMSKKKRFRGVGFVRDFARRSAGISLFRENLLGSGKNIAVKLLRLSSLGLCHRVHLA